MSKVKPPSKQHHELDPFSDRHTKSVPRKQVKILINRLNRIEGQIRGIKGMVEESAYCDDILQQISAVQSAMKSISKIVIQDHVEGCLFDRIKSGDTEVIDELLDTVGKLLKI